MLTYRKTQHIMHKYMYINDFDGIKSCSTNVQLEISHAFFFSENDFRWPCIFTLVHKIKILVLLACFKVIDIVWRVICYAM